MARKDATVVVLDVGPHMAPHLPHLRRSLFLLAEGKLLNNPSHELGLVLYGTTATRNEVHAECEAAGDPEQYKHITVAHPLKCPDLDSLRLLNALACGRGYSDHVSALLVALDLVKKATTARRELTHKTCKRRILMIGSFDTEVEAIDPELRESVLQQFGAMDVALEAFGAADGAPARSPEAASLREANLAGLHELIAQVGGSYVPLPTAASMAALFKLRSTAPTGAKLSLTIGTSVSIEVQLYKKTAREKLPPLPAYNPPVGGGEGKVARVTLYAAPSNPEVELAPQDRIKAYKYGSQLVPIPDAATEELLKYQPGKRLELLAFVQRGEVPRWHYDHECWVALPQAPAHAAALSALVRGMAQTDKLAVLRMCYTERSEVVLLAASPLPAPPGAVMQPDALLLNRLPYQDDLRHYLFRSFRDTNPKLAALRPSREQAALMRQLVAHMRLAPGPAPAVPSQAGGPSQTGSSAAAAAAGPDREQLVPGETLNPMLQRFYWFMGQRALEPSTPVPAAADDAYAAAVLDQPPLDSLPPPVREVLQQLGQAFPIVKPERRESAADGAAAAAAAAAGAGPGERAAVISDESGVRLVTGVSTSAPVADFQALVAHGKLEVAFSGVQAAVLILVDDSLGDRNYSRACEAVAAMRAAALQQQGRAAAFNAFLASLRERYATEPSRREFWLRLLGPAFSVSPISEAEAPGQGTGMDAAAAAAWVAAATADLQLVAAPGEPTLAATALDAADEFADMD